MTDALPSVGFVGLGRMGANMALRLVDEGFSLTVTDLVRAVGEPLVAAGAVWADTPAQVAAEADIVLSSLPGPPEVEAAAVGPSGIIEGIRPGGLWIDLSSSSPLLIQRLAARFAEKNASAIDSPVSGGIKHSREGTLTMFCSGTDAEFERAEKVLSRMTRKLLHVGAVGSGSIVKIMNNATVLSTLALISEVLSIGVKAGFDHRELLAALKEGGYGQGEVLNFHIPVVAFTHQYEPAGFALDLGRKDLGLATQLGRELNVPMPIVGLVEQAAVELVARGHGSKDSTMIFSLQEVRADVVLHDEDTNEVEI